MFLVLAILVVFFKTGLYAGALNDNIAEFKKKHKQRLNVQSVVLKVVQLISFIIIGFRFITTCDADRNKSDPIKEDNNFTFYIENYVYLSLKILILLLLLLRLFKLTRSPNFPLASHKPRLSLLMLTLTLSIVN